MYLNIKFLNIFGKIDMWETLQGISHSNIWYIIFGITETYNIWYI